MFSIETFEESGKGVVASWILCRVQPQVRNRFDEADTSADLWSGPVPVFQPPITIRNAPRGLYPEPRWWNHRHPHQTDGLGSVQEQGFKPSQG